ncbi:MAG: sporulation initiation factor Spo0A C-terminal domain-containing protein [Christensenellales bacterium]|jgi:hypothetical protein
MRSLVSKYLLYLGFNPVRCGYKYLSELIVMHLKGEEIHPLKLNGYLKVGIKYNKSSDVIDKNIQNSISHVWLKGDSKCLEKEFGSTIDPSKGKPTNKHFIATITEKIKLLDAPGR